jgi:hypothetical protein
LARKSSAFVQPLLALDWPVAAAQIASIDPSCVPFPVEGSVISTPMKFGSVRTSSQFW